MAQDDLASWVRSHATHGAIDACVNANPPAPDGVPPAANPLGAPPVRQSAADLVGEMDRLGVNRAIVGPPVPSAGLSEVDGYRWTLEAVQRYPDRLALAVSVDPNGLMDAVRALETMVRSDGAVAVRFSPARIGKPLTNRMYFPIYTKCVELGLPVMATVGIPGPKIPGMVQHPKYLDELCYLWPELTVVTTHGGEPWTGLLVKLMSKWPNLYHVLSAFAPKYYPRDTVAFLNSSRGRGKVMFGTDHPFLPMERVLRELVQAGITDEAMGPFLAGNASRVFFNDK